MFPKLLSLSDVLDRVIPFKGFPINSTPLVKLGVFDDALKVIGILLPFLLDLSNFRVVLIVQ